jgi:hypothetical protein
LKGQIETPAPRIDAHVAEDVRDLQVQAQLDGVVTGGGVLVAEDLDGREAHRGGDAQAVPAQVLEGRVAPDGEVHAAAGHDVLEARSGDRKLEDGGRQLAPSSVSGAPRGALHLFIPPRKTRLSLSTRLVHAVVDRAAERVEGVDRSPLLNREDPEGIREAAPALPRETSGEAHAVQRKARHARPALAARPWRGRFSNTS